MYIRAKVHRMITTQARPRQTDGQTHRRTTIMAIARRDTSAPLLLFCYQNVPSNKLKQQWWRELVLFA